MLALLHRLTHRQIEAFRAVIETGKMTAAAETLGTTQPSVSKMIADLEQVAAGVGISIVEPVTAKQFALSGRVLLRPLVPEQPFRYDLLLPALRQPSRVASRFLELVERKFTTLFNT